MRRVLTNSLLQVEDEPLPPFPPFLPFLGLEGHQVVHPRVAQAADPRDGALVDLDHLCFIKSRGG